MAETPQTIEVNVVMGAQLRAIVRSALIHVKNKVMDTPVLDSTKHAVKRIIDEELVKWPLAVAPDEPDTLGEWLYNRFGYDHGKPDWFNMDQDARSYWEHEAAAVRRAVGRGGFKSAREGSGFVLSTPINELHQADKESGDGPVASLRPLDLKNVESLGEAIRIAVGAASTCWQKLDQAGIFKSDEALDISRQLEHYMQKRIAEAIKGVGIIHSRHQTLGKVLENYRESGAPLINVQQAYNILCGQSTPAEYASALQEYPNSEGPRTPGFDGPEGETTAWKAT